MKKILYSLLIGTSLVGYAQESSLSDALRYGIENINGTARFRAMGGAFGAIGGDLSAININPAGSSIFNHNQATISLTNFNTSNNANYFGTSTKSRDNNLDINQLGAVFVFNDNYNTSGWNKFALGLNYENASNFDNYIVSQGTNPYNSMDNYFLNFANNPNIQNLNGAFYEDLDFNSQQAWLGYNAYVLDYNSGGNNYFTNVPSGGNYFHKNIVETKGYNGKFAVNFSGAYQDKLYLGMNMNFYFNDYTKNSSLYESNNNTTNNPGDFLIRTAKFNNSVYTYGSGFSMNLGAIYKASQNVRLGLAYETPTWYKLNDELTQSISSIYYDATTTLLNEVNVNPNVVNVYTPYKIKTPSKLTASGTILFGKKGLLSVDYITKNYEETKFKPTNDDTYNALNAQVKNTLQNNYELRVGGEYKIKKLSIRGGYRYEQSPYKVNEIFGDLLSYSGGLGYNFGNQRLDVSYTNEHRTRNLGLLTSGLNDPARIKNYNNNVTLTYVVNF